MKGLFNALDNDGSLLGWLTAHGLASAPPPAFELPDGTVFDLQAYIDSRVELTAKTTVRGGQKRAKRWIQS